MSNPSSATAENAVPKLPDKFCDIVMEGGITSGVVYPWAVKQLSDTYQFKNIGGTSAGAIAAAATAAAELGRSKGLASFQMLNALPTWLGEMVPSLGKSHLFALFQPQPATQALFQTLVAFLGETKGKWQRVLIAACRHYPSAAILGLLPGVILLILAMTASNLLLTIWGILSGLLLAIIGLLLGVIITVVYNVTQVLPANFYGLCTGHQAEQEGPAQALTDWLTDYLDELAGLATDGRPLTFGDLWQQPTSATGKPVTDSERVINLAMITTNLSHGRPYTLPFDNHPFYFDPVEFAQFFPARVVQWMQANTSQNDDDVLQFNDRALLPLPAADKLPVVVATRMSLSFPFLLSAVPLYAVDYAKPTAPAKQKLDVAAQVRQLAQPPAPRQAERCWFSDGGITVNFPLHFFDQPMPRWPTFGIDLQTPRPEYVLATDERQNVWMPEDNRSGIAPQWSYFEPVGGLSKLIAFGAAIFSTARTWQINTQMTAPGYRDRVAHIFVADDEGGLNLNMPADNIRRLGERGQQAGTMFTERFADPDTTHRLSWANHRWIRYRTAMSLLEKILSHMCASYHEQPNGALSYADLITRSAETMPTSYPWVNQAQRDFAAQITQKLIALADEWQQSEQRFGEEAPKPIPDLEIRPRL